MYYAFVIPHFYYCSTVWYDDIKNKLTKMSKLQKKAARIITGDSYDIRSNEHRCNLSAHARVLSLIEGKWRILKALCSFGFQEDQQCFCNSDC